MAFDIFSLYRELTKEGIIFCFCGSASQHIVEGIGETLLQRMEMEGTEMGVIGRVFPIFVEQMQNVVSHSADRIATSSRDGNELEELSFGMVIVGKQNGRFYVRCGNFVENRETGMLAKRLKELQHMDKEQLKILYKEERRKAKAEKRSKGAGLGFIDMARKASEPLEFSITPVDEERSFFSMTTVV
jgi:hypothetical protein